MEKIVFEKSDIRDFVKTTIAEKKLRSLKLYRIYHGSQP